MEGTYYTPHYLLHQSILLCATNNSISRCYCINISDKSAITCTQSCLPHNRLQHSTFYALTAVLLVTPALCTVTLRCPSDPSVLKHYAAFTFQGQAVQTLNQYPSEQNQNLFTVQNYVFQPISRQPQVQNWSLKHKKPISSSIWFKDQLWTWQWPEIGQSMLFCTINRTWLCSERYWLNVGTINNRKEWYSLKMVKQSFWDSVTLADEDNIYSHALHNDVSVNDRPYIQRWSHNIRIL
jgi:hypothetical protein